MRNGSGTIDKTSVTNVIVACTQTGRFAYVANRQSNSISGFAIDPGQRRAGALERLAICLERHDADRAHRRSQWTIPLCREQRLQFRFRVFDRRHGRAERGRFADCGGKRPGRSERRPHGSLSLCGKPDFQQCVGLRDQRQRLDADRRLAVQRRARNRLLWPSIPTATFST